MAKNAEVSEEEEEEEEEEEGGRAKPFRRLATSRLLAGDQATSRKSQSLSLEYAIMI